METGFSLTPWFGPPYPFARGECFAQDGDEEANVAQDVRYAANKIILALGIILSMPNCLGCTEYVELEIETEKENTNLTNKAGLVTWFLRAMNGQ